MEELPGRAVLLEEHGAAQRPGLAEQRPERAAQLLGAEGFVLEERQLPAVERLGELRVAVGVGERGEHVDGYRRTEAVETGRLTRRLRRGDRENRADAERARVERLEEDRPGRERGRGGRGEAR